MSEECVPAPGPPLKRGGRPLSEPCVPTRPGPPFTRGGKPSAEPSHRLRIPVYSTLTQSNPDTIMGFARGWLIADDEAHKQWSFADGVCPLEWRQGLKHDAAGVMELVRDLASGLWLNRGGDVVDVEPDFVYALVKGTDLTRPPGSRPDRAILVTQKHLGEDTERLAYHAPRLWGYLQSHAAAFLKRKSSIYRGQPPFSLFGIGPYSFAPYKVAISGMHKEPRFQALGPVGGRPVMLDDTCYFLPCSTAEEASLFTALCNDPITLGLIASMSFRDAKRPITKKLLQRIDLSAILQHTDRSSLLARATAVLSNELASQPTEPLCDVVERVAQRFSQSDS